MQSKKNPHDSWPTFYGLPMFVIFSVYVCACVEGCMVENAEFYDIFVYYQYADCAKAQHEPNMHTKRCILRKGVPKNFFGHKKAVRAGNQIYGDLSWHKRVDQRWRFSFESWSLPRPQKVGDPYGRVEKSKLSYGSHRMLIRKLLTRKIHMCYLQCSTNNILKNRDVKQNGRKIVLLFANIF